MMRWTSSSFTGREIIGEQVPVLPPVANHMLFLSPINSQLAQRPEPLGQEELRGCVARDFPIRRSILLREE